MEETTKKIIKYIKTNDIEQLKQIVSEQTRPDEKVIDYLVTFSNIEDIKEVLNTEKNKKIVKSWSIPNQDKYTKSTPGTNENEEVATMQIESKDFGNNRLVSDNSDETHLASDLIIKEKGDVENMMANNQKKNYLNANNKRGDDYLNNEKFAFDKVNKDGISEKEYHQEKCFSLRSKPNKKKLDTKFDNESQGYKKINKIVDPNLVLKKYFVNNSTRDKIISLFFETIRNKVKSVDFDRVAYLAQSIVVELVKVEKIGDKNFIRTKMLNLKDPKNPELCEKLYEGDITPARYIQMTVDEMKSDKLKKVQEQIILDSLNDAQQPKMQADTDMFKCGKCKESKTTYYQLQTRSADEPMTTFVTCVVCNNRWKF